MLFADVILPLPLPVTFTYAVPENLESQIGIGYRVIVPFRGKKHYTALVLKLHNVAPKHIKIKEIHSLIDTLPVVIEQQLILWEWISFYYLSPIGDVYKAAVPSQMRNLNSSLTSLYSPRKETFLRLVPQIKTGIVFESIGKAKKQLQLFNEIKEILLNNEIEFISKKELNGIVEISPAVLNGLIKKGIIEQFSKETSSLPNIKGTSRKPYHLNDYQNEALKQIKDIFLSKDKCLLHGIASSGKTEIYITLINEYISNGKQVLYLLPEIALTMQLTKRIQAVFGERAGIYHSQINDRERAELWLKMLSDNPYEIIIGVRSSIFIPFQNLGLVIIDEEHEISYKQQDPAPRFHARDTAIVLAQQYGAKVLLGSATPSFESYFNARTGKYGLVTLKNRFMDLGMPSIVLENTRELRRTKKMKSSFSPNLLNHMHEVLSKNEQTILFRNRRGYSLIFECEQCAWTPKCADCDVTLTFHKNRNILICHYCNKTYQVPHVCPSCGGKNLKHLGEGTEQLEQEISEKFPDVNVLRLDTDTAQGKNSIDNILSEFSEKKAHILIGTQMISKGLDFDDVSVVGIISADSLLNFPDFRSHEKGFQLIVQAAGRAGRKKEDAKVFIQTADPSQPVYKYIVEGDYEGFYLSEITERELFKYPPFNRLISICFKHKDESTVAGASQYFSDILRKSLNEQVLGPNKPTISKIKSIYIREILLKLDKQSLKDIREILFEIENKLKNIEKYRTVLLQYNVDPL